MKFSPVVETEKGKIVGENIKDVYIFRGVPYGSDTGGKNRFLPPSPAKKWAGVKQCLTLGDKSPQISALADNKENLKNNPILSYVSNAMGLWDPIVSEQKEERSENCLNLNIVTPQCDHKKRPVLVYIHGGGFSSGSGNFIPGSYRLAKEEDVVTVGINDRLNVFGYLYLGHLDSKYKYSGINGLLDCLLALKWIQENIGCFGGDPKNVTVIGESGGAMKICHLLQMAKARGLFCKAILVSGVTPTGLIPIKKAAEITDAILSKLGIDKVDWQKILTMPAQELVDKTNDPALFSQALIPFFPSVQADIIPDNPEEKFGVAEWAKDMPIIVGSSEDELGFQTVGLSIRSEAEALQLLKTQGVEHYHIKDFESDQFVKEVYETFKKEDKRQNNPWQLCTKIVSQLSILGHGAYQFACAKADQGGHVYLYDTAYRHGIGLGDDFKCAWHTADLLLMFRSVYFPEDETISRSYGQAIGQFMKTGSPDLSGQSWEPFNPKKGKMEVFDEQTTFRKDPLADSRKMIIGAINKQIL